MNERAGTGWCQPFRFLIDLQARAGLRAVQAFRLCRPSCLFMTDLA